MRPDLAIVVALASGCSHWRTERTEMPAGTCADVQRREGGSCRRTAIDQAITVSVSSPREHQSELGASASYRWRAFEVVLDERRVHRSTDPVDPRGYHSLAAGGGIHVGPLALWPALYRYIDLAAIAGLDLGVMNFDGVVRGRGDLYYGADLVVTMPDVGPLRYLEGGVPAVHVGLRRTSYVEDWSSATSLELGLVWRWGTPIDIHSKKVFRLMLD